MEYLWWLLIVAVMVGYPLFVVRCALRGHRWARDTLEAMRYVGGDLLTGSTWMALPPEAPDDGGAEAAERHFLA